MEKTENSWPEATSSKKYANSQGVHIKDDQPTDTNKEAKKRSSDTSVSKTASSVYSEKDKKGEQQEILEVKHHAAKKERKKKRNKRLYGKGQKVQKRRKPAANRVKRLKKYSASISTVFTRLTGCSSGTDQCKYCGHRCCLKRYRYLQRRRQRMTKRNQKRRKVNRRVKFNRRIKYKRAQNSIKLPDLKIIVSQGMQAGSRCPTLSPLFLNCNEIGDEAIEAEYCEITPVMMYEALRSLTMWVAAPNTAAICSYIKRNFPVNQNEEELMIELIDKLQIAVQVDNMIARVDEDSWMLGQFLKERKPSPNHVAKFWKIYIDTMKPIQKSKPTATVTEPDNKNIDPDDYV